MLWIACQNEDVNASSSLLKNKIKGTMEKDATTHKVPQKGLYLHPLKNFFFLIRFWRSVTWVSFNQFWQSYASRFWKSKFVQSLTKFRSQCEVVAKTSNFSLAFLNLQRKRSRHQKALMHYYYETMDALAIMTYLKTNLNCRISYQYGHYV